MASKRVVIVGGGIAGCAAARSAMEAEPDSQVTVLDREAHGPYSRRSLARALSGEVESFESLIELTPGKLGEIGIEYRTGVSVAIIEPMAKRIDVQTGHTTENLFYDSLVLATGGMPKVPKLGGMRTAEGKAKDGIFVLRTLDDGKRMREACKSVKTAVVVGAGVKGLEIATALSKLGLAVTIVESEGCVLPEMLDADMAGLVEARMRDLGIGAMTGTNVVSLDGENRVESVTVKKLSDGESSRVYCDLLAFAAGASPVTDLAKAAGCRIGPAGGIAVDGGCATSVPYVHAAGNCAEFANLITGAPSLTDDEGIVRHQGRMAGLNAAGRNVKGPSGYIEVKGLAISGLDVATAGLTSVQMKKFNVGSTISRVSTLGSAHGGIFIARDGTGALVGAQLAGKEGTRRLASACATAIAKGMKAGDVARMDVSSLPPYDFS